MLAYVVTRVPFLYHRGFPDGDQQHIALGILDGILSGRYFGAARLYGQTFSFGYYAAHFAMGSIYAARPSLIFEVMNWSGLIAGLIAIPALYRLVAEFRVGGVAALVAAWLWTFAPGWWELTTFGHPSTIALSLYVASLALFAVFLDRHSSRAYAALAASALLYFLTLTVRADFMLGAPLFLALPLLRANQGPRPYAGAVAVVLVSAGLFVVAHRGVFPASDGAGSSAAMLVRRAISVRSPDPRIALKELVVSMLGLGSILFAVGLLGLLRLFLQGSQRRTGIVLACGLLPSVAWWFQVEGPFRHLLLPALLLVVAAALAISDLRLARNVRTAVWLALGLSLLNQVAADLLYPAIASRYPWSYRAVAGERRWSTRAPLGDWFWNHAAASRGVSRESREAQWLAGESPDSVLVLTPSSYRAEFEFLARFPRTYEYARIESPGRGVEWITLRAPERTLFFLSGDPQPLADELQRALASHRVPATRVFVPAAGEPSGVRFPLSGLRLVPAGSIGDTPAP